MKIVVIQHEKDFQGEQRVYFIEVIARCWREAGHEVVFINGLQKNIEADLAIMHVNLSVVPDEYVRYAMQFPVTLNLNVTDIRKRTISQYLVEPNDDYDGDVIVKTDKNCGGIPEAKIYNQALPKRRSVMRFARKFVRKTRNAGIKLNLINTDARRYVKTEYRESFSVFEHKDQVPEYIWNDEDWIVEQFLPEIEDSRFVIRNAYFLGDKMICFKTVGSDPIVKEDKDLRSKKIKMPKKIIHLRNKFGLDYGKIDFVIINEEPVLLDIGKTIGGGDFGRDTAIILAEGIHSYLVTENEVCS
ncbi:MAG: hypothetical protein RI575_04265 [Balneolaceae bacterium]|nr:hypothetical protein [Balneolaceae bacterium]MDR9409247.1 hypothetical protein [Balneolaceae bacterium]